MPLHHWRKNHESAASKDLKSIDLLDEKNSTKERRVYFKPVVRIERMTTGKVVSREKPQGEQRNYAHFAGAWKPLGLNVTNCESLEALSGSPDPKDWVGLVIGLYVDPQAKYPGKKGRGPAIRINPKRVPTNVRQWPRLPAEISEATRAELTKEQDDLLGLNDEPEPPEEAPEENPS